MEQKLNTLKERLADVLRVNQAVAVLSWDQQTYMPEGGTQDRGDHLATLSKLAHEMFTSDDVGRLFDDLKPYAEQLEPDSDDARLIAVTDRRYRKQTRVPSKWVAEYAQATAVAHQAWVEARHDSNFAHFQPNLERIIELRRQYADMFAPYEHVYDPLLDDFEPGMKTTEVQQIFGALRPQQVALIQAISQRPQIDDGFLLVHYDEQKQWDFGVEVVTRYGYDWKRGRQDRSPHPFTTSFGIGDVRITTRFDPLRIHTALFGTMHEAGHAMYEQGIDPALGRTPLADGASLGVHESQSRMWENLVGRSREFWSYFFPRFKEYFPGQVGNVDLETFYRAINKVEPSLIRVEADEATYNLHIMLRLELEIALMEGSLQASQLPEAWNTRFQEYLGITPPNDALGVLQDIHWSEGLFGYFPTYALGNLISLQLWEKINQDIPDLPDQICRGEFGALLGWLRENIHRHGAKYEPQDLVQRVTGSKINPEPYVRYLRSKFSEIYGL